MNNITLEPLNADNWYAVCQLSVTDEQKQVFPVSNVYWIAISRYEEKSELFAIKSGDNYVGLVGGGLDEDGESGFVNPIMVDKNFQKQGIAERAMRLIIEHLSATLSVPRINIGYRKANLAAGRLYEKLGFAVTGEDGDDCIRTLHL